MEIYLMRHGQTPNNVNAMLTGQSDVPLTEYGIKQIQAVAPLLKEIQWDRVIVSPLSRAIHTASIVAPHAEMEYVSWLKEFDFGFWTGHTWKEIEEMDPEGLARYRGDWKYGRAADGECFMDMYQRVSEGIREVVRTSHADAKILIVAHAGPVDIMPVALMNLPVEAYHHFIPLQGVYSKFVSSRTREGEVRFRLERWNMGPNV